MAEVCEIDGCGKPARRRKWCAGHYDRWRRHGDPTAGRTPDGLPEKFLHETVMNYQGDDCLKWPFGRITGGYGNIQVNGKMRRVPRIVCEIVHGPPPTPDHEAAHSCGKGHEGCCAPAHLSWKTHAENMQDKLQHGTHNRGERNGSAKLNENDVRKIRALAGTMLQHDIAKQFGITRIMVNLIINRKSWAWLSD